MDDDQGDMPIGRQEKMQGIETKQRVGFVMIATAVLMASFVVVAPQVASAAGNPYSEYRFVFANSMVLEGSTAGQNGFEAPVFDTGETIHVSCSDVFDSGLSSNGAFPSPSDGAGWEILSYTIDRYKGTGEYHFSCGETFELGSITVLKDATPATESFDFSLTGSVNGETGSYVGSTQSVFGDASDSYTWSELEAGTYTLSELMSNAQVEAGWAFTGVTCTGGGYTAGLEAATIYLDGGADVTCTFADEKDVDDVKPVVVKIVQGSCDYRDGVSETNTTFSFRHDGVNTSGKVEMTVTGPSGTFVLSEKTEIELAAGTYTWTAESIHPDYELLPPHAGEFVLPECAPDAKPVSVAIDLGTCVWDGENSWTGVIASINPDGKATITVDGSLEFTFDGQTLNVGPGAHTWTASPASGYKLEEPSSGEFVAEDCAPPSSLGDTVWHDVDGDGVQDDNEPGVPGIDVGLYVDGIEVAFAVTDDNGLYLFEDLEPGVAYTVVFTIPDAWTITLQDIGDDALDSDAGADGKTIPVVLAPGESNLTVDAGVVSSVGTVVVTKQTDTESDQDFTFTVGDSTIELTSGESAEFDLISGTYTITELVVDGWDLVSIICSGDSELVGDTGVSLFVPPGETVGCTFVNSELDAPLGVIGDYVWHDANTDGVQDDNEPGVESVEVDLIETSSGDVIGTTTTDSSGVYVFVNVPAGSYIVEFTIPDTWAFTTPDAGSDDAVDSDVVGATGPVGQTEEFDLAAGEVNTTVDAGVYLINVLPETPVTPTPETPVTRTSTTPVTPTPNTPATPATPTPATPTAVDDTKVLGIQTELPATGFADWQAGLLAIALIMGGAGVLLVIRKEEDGPGIADLAGL